MEFAIHTTALTQERVVQQFNNAVSELPFILEDSSSFVVHPMNRLFRKIKGRFDPHDNVENAWFLVKMLLSLTKVDNQACITVFDVAGNGESVDEREDFFTIHFPEQMQTSSSRALLYREKVIIVPNCVDELSAVLRCRSNVDGFTCIELSSVLDKPIALSLPQRIKLEKLPSNIARAILQVPELIPLACLVECGNPELIKQMLTSSQRQQQQQVDMVVTVSRFSYAVLYHRTNQQRKTMTQLIVEGLAHLIEENDQYEEDKSRALELEWFSLKPLRQLFLSPTNAEDDDNFVVDEEADSDAWLREGDDEEDEEAHADIAWTELEKELNNPHEFDGVIHESTSKPVEFSSEEFFKILNTH